jgi:hypothetical protein
MHILPFVFDGNSFAVNTSGLNSGPDNKQAK